MQTSLSYYITLARRWAWMVVLGVVICGGATYIVSKLTPPVYEATSVLIINIKTSTSAYDNITASQLAATTYAQVLTSPQVLKPVLEQHPELSQQQLSAMVTAKSQPNSSIIEIAVDSSNPAMSAELANEVSQSSASYLDGQFQGQVQTLPAEVPSTPIRPKPLQYTAIGALVGLALAIALIVIFELVDDRLTRPEEVQEFLGMEILGAIPRLSRKQRRKNADEIPALAEGFRKLCASLNAQQAIQPFKLVMITSALPGEGKSTIAANLASFLAKANKCVLLVDADLRRPMLNQHFQLDNRQGLSDVFLNTSSQPKVTLYGQEADIPNLRVLTAGVPVANPADLFQSPVVNQLFDSFNNAPFDYVIFDTSPLLPVADAQILASHMHAIVLAVDVSKTTRKVLQRAKQVLSMSKTRATVGIVINKSRWPDAIESRYYLNDFPEPGTETPMTMPPTTPPPVGDAISSEITMILPSAKPPELFGKGVQGNPPAGVPGVPPGFPPFPKR